ncbi:MAG: DUF6152 family protein [Steroidobacteraceae bacterium]
MLVAVCATSIGYAHHSYAMYDAEKTVAYTGTISRVRWANPHVWMELMVPGSDGGAAKAVNIEFPSPEALKSVGWGKDAVAVGDKVIAAIHPLRSGQPAGAIVNMVKNGVTMEAHKKNETGQQGAGK